MPDDVEHNRETFLVSDTSDCMIEDYDLEESSVDFPTKKECNGSLRRKRHALKVMYRKNRRLLQVDTKGANYMVCELVSRNKGVPYSEENAVYARRGWRKQRSKWIKRMCNRGFRRRHKYDTDLLVSRSKCIHHKETDFWWTVD